jgi:hypothetical protein
VIPVATDAEVAGRRRGAGDERQAQTAAAGQADRPSGTAATPAAPPRETPIGGTVAAPPAATTAVAPPAAGVVAVSPLAAAELAIARLEGRVAALEAALERRSDELRRLQSHLCQRDLAQWTRMAAGLLPLPRIAHEPACWQETLELAGADVPETLEDLWASLYPAPPARTAPR